MSTRIRTATIADVPLVLELINDLAVYERAEPGAVTATIESITEAMFPATGHGQVTGFIGEVDGVAQGFAICFMNFSSWVGRPGLYLEDLYVRPAARGHGLGKALLAEVARLAVKRGCKRLDWVVLDWNEPAINFYKSIGADVKPDWRLCRLTGDDLSRVAAL